MRWMRNWLGRRYSPGWADLAIVFVFVAVAVFVAAELGRVMVQPNGIVHASGFAQTNSITVVDGDTIRVNGVSWRLMGFDTPETYYARCNAEYRAGVLAKQELESLLRRAQNVQTVSGGRRDRYGRVLGRLYVDGKDVGEILIARGLARRYDGHGPRQSWCG